MASRSSLKSIRLERDNYRDKDSRRFGESGSDAVHSEDSIGRVLIKISHQIRGMAKVNVVQDGTQSGNNN